jgi:ankyrin repeat protein
VSIRVKNSQYGQTPLSWAAEQGHEAVVKLLLKTGKVDVDAKDNDSRTPLSWTAEQGHKAVVKLLLEISKVEVDAKDKYGRTPLLCSLWRPRGRGQVIT